MEDNNIKRCPALARLRKGFVAACSIDPTGVERRAWIGIYPLHQNKLLKVKGDYRLRVFEVDERFLKNDNEVWENVMISRADACVTDESSLLARIEEFIDPSCLGDPQGCNYPI